MASVRVEVNVGNREYSVVYDLNEVEEQLWDGSASRSIVVGNLGVALDNAVTDIKRAVGEELQ